MISLSAGANAGVQHRIGLPLAIPSPACFVCSSVSPVLPHSGVPIAIPTGPDAIVLQKGDATREMLLEDFYLDYQKTALQRGEFVRSLIVEAPNAPLQRLFRSYKVAKRLEQQGENGTLEVTSGMTIHRDRRDQRDVYRVAREDYKQNDLSGFDLVQVKLVLRMAKHKDRRAHNIVVQITAPNGLNDNAKTEDERQLVMRLLKRWNIVTEF